VNVLQIRIGNSNTKTYVLWQSWRSLKVVEIEKKTFYTFLFKPMFLFCCFLYSCNLMKLISRTNEHIHKRYMLKLIPRFLRSILQLFHITTRK